MDPRPNQGYGGKQPLRQPNPQSGNSENVTTSRGERGSGRDFGNFPPPREIGGNNQQNADPRQIAPLTENREMPSENRFNSQASSQNLYVSNLSPGAAGPSHGNTNQISLTTNSGTSYDFVDSLASLFGPDFQNFFPEYKPLDSNRNDTSPSGGSVAPTNLGPSTSRAEPNSMAATVPLNVNDKSKLTSEAKVVPKRERIGFNVSSDWDSTGSNWRRKIREETSARTLSPFASPKTKQIAKVSAKDELEMVLNLTLKSCETPSPPTGQSTTSSIVSFGSNAAKKGSSDEDEEKKEEKPHKSLQDPDED